MVLSGIPWNLLQENIQYFKEDDPMAGILLMIAIVSIVVISFVVNLIKNGIGATGIQSSMRKTAPRKFSGFVLHRLAGVYKLNKEQTKLLEQIFRSHGITDPRRVMKDPKLLDEHFKRAYKTIERISGTEEARQQKISLLFSLRYTIENVQRIENTITTTQQIADNSNIALIIENESYPVRVFSSGKDTISVECPRNTQGKPLSIPKGSRVTLSFFTKSSTGYSFDTQVLGAVQTSKGPAIQIAHSFRAKPLNYQRKFRRKQTDMACNFYLIYIEDVKTGWKKKQKMSMDKHKYSGIVLNISIGGCAIKTNASVPAGSRLKIEFNKADSQPLAVLGQILRLNKSGSKGTIVHIKFIKVPRRAWNAINTMVFEYEE
jgi:hypothetical protein